MKVTGATVVSKALPDLKDRFDRGLGQIREGGEPREEALVVPDRRVHPGLLEQDLGDPDRVWIPRASPGKRAIGFPVPREQVLLEEGPVFHAVEYALNAIVYFN